MKVFSHQFTVKGTKSFWKKYKLENETLLKPFHLKIQKIYPL
jgi:hypothetical protein